MGVAAGSWSEDHPVMCHPMADENTTPRALVVDGCAPLLSKPGAWEGWVEGGVHLAMPTVATHEGPEEALGRVGEWKRWTDGDQEVFLADSLSDLDRLRDGRLGIVFHFQNTTPLGESLGLLGEYHGLGVRMIQLTYNHRNAVGDGCMDPEDRGLTGFGRDLIGEMNRLGMVIDLSHTGCRTTLEAIEASAHPTVFSHSNARRLFDHPRNIADQQIRAVAETGGLVGVNAVSAFLRTDGVGANLSDVVDHIDYLVEMIGSEHVGLALDFWSDIPIDYSEWTRDRRWRAAIPSDQVNWPEGLCGPGHIPRIAGELEARGYPAEAIDDIMGRSWIRLLRSVWN